LADRASGSGLAIDLGAKIIGLVGCSFQLPLRDRPHPEGSKSDLPMVRERIKKRNAESFFP